MFVGASEIEIFFRFPPIFFSISLAPTNIVVRVHTKVTEKHEKLKEFTEKHGNLCGGERVGHRNIRPRMRAPMLFQVNK